MTAGRWQRMEELFTQALKVPAAERAVFLAEASAGDDSLRVEVERLLSTYGQATQFLEPDSEQRAQVLRSIEDTLLIGSSLGPYRIEALLGGGGMGIVYRARDKRQEMDVAVKVLRQEALADSAARKRFTQECRAAAALDHPCIVRVLEVDEQDGVHFLVMELVAGRTLRDLIAAGPVPFPDTVRYACQVADALAAAHAKGVTHRDIKPANVMITPQGNVKVLDFGLCQWIANRPDGASSTHTHGRMFGESPGAKVPDRGGLNGCSPSSAAGAWPGTARARGTSCELRDMEYASGMAEMDSGRRRPCRSCLAVLGRIEAVFARAYTG